MALKIGGNKIKLSWDDLENLVDKLCQKIPFETPLVDSVIFSTALWIADVNCS